jgi:hypothetical protein
MGYPSKQSGAPGAAVQGTGVREVHRGDGVRGMRLTNVVGTRTVIVQ